MADSRNSGWAVEKQQDGADAESKADVSWRTSRTDKSGRSERTEEDGEIEREVQTAGTVQNARSSAKMGTTKMRVDVEVEEEKDG
jgi:hypothetical protein